MRDEERSLTPQPPLPLDVGEGEHWVSAELEKNHWVKAPIYPMGEESRLFSLLIGKEPLGLKPLARRVGEGLGVRGS